MQQRINRVIVRGVKTAAVGKIQPPPHRAIGYDTLGGRIVLSDYGANDGRDGTRAYVDLRTVGAGGMFASLRDLASLIGVSPHHLSRVFRTVTGTTIARHRMRLRARAALERLAGGDTDLAGVAYATGFADQSHLTRVLKAETGTTPAALRRALGG